MQDLIKNQKLEKLLIISFMHFSSSIILVILEVFYIFGNEEKLVALLV